jgi:hypothetical protein
MASVFTEELKIHLLEASLRNVEHASVFDSDD